MQKGRGTPGTRSWLCAARSRARSPCTHGSSTVMLILKRSFLTSNTKVMHWSFFIITTNSKEQMMVLQERFFSESASFWGWVRLPNPTLKARFRKPGKQSTCFLKFLQGKKKKGLTGCSTCKERSNRKGRRGKENRKSPFGKKLDWLPWTNETKIQKITRYVSYHHLSPLIMHFSASSLQTKEKLLQ